MMRSEFDVARCDGFEVHFWEKRANETVHVLMGVALLGEPLMRCERFFPLRLSAYEYRQ
jgi:hypothetical protein